MKAAIAAIALLGIQVSVPVKAFEPVPLLPPAQTDKTISTKTNHREEKSIWRVEKKHGDQMQLLLLEADSIPYTLNAINDAGVASGKSDPVLAKWLAAVQKNSGQGLGSTAGLATSK